MTDTHEKGPISAFDRVLLHKEKGEVRAICLTLFRFGKWQGSRNSKNATREQRPDWRQVPKPSNNTGNCPELNARVAPGSTFDGRGRPPVRLGFELRLPVAERLERGPLNIEAISATAARQRVQQLSQPLCRSRCWPMPFGWDKPGRRHLGSFILPLQPTGEATHHAQTMRPRVVVRIRDLWRVVRHRAGCALNARMLLPLISITKTIMAIEDSVRRSQSSLDALSSSTGMLCLDLPVPSQCGQSGRSGVAGYLAAGFNFSVDHCSPVPPHSLHFCSPQSTVGFRLAISDLHHSAVSRRAGRDNHDEGKIASILVRPGRTMRPGQGLPARQRAFQIRVAAVGLARGLQDSRGSAPDRDLCPRVSPASPSRSSSTAAPRRDSSGRSETTGQAPQDGRHGRVASFGEGVHFCSDTALGAQIHCPW